MKIFNYVFLLSFLTTSLSFAQDSNWDLVFSDEFNTDGAVNSSKWFHQTQLPNGWGWYNNEQQHYTNRTENSYVENGILKIVAKKENFNDQGHTKPYTSARLNSKFAFQYGKVEVRAKLPSGVGTWPAIWTLGKNITEPGAYFTTTHGTTPWPACGEIDIMEHWGNNQNYVQSATHTPSSHGGTINHGGQMIYTASSQMHTYGLVWTPEKLVFSVDGVEHYTYNPAEKNAETWPFDAEQFLLLNFAISENVDPSFTQDAMEIDYVRVYQPSNGDYTTDVTFQVDMSNEQVHSGGVWVAGGNMGQEGYLMTNQGNDLWAVTLPLSPNERYEYKFRNQPSLGTWNGFESPSGILAGGCSSGNAYDDRFVVVGENDMTLDVVTYGSCTDERDSGNNNDNTSPNPPTGVISIFSNDYDNIPNVEFDPNWGQSTEVTVDDELVYTNLNYQGTSFDSQDVSDYDYFHLDYYTDNSTELNIYVISLDPTRDGDSYPLNIEYGKWNTVKIPLTAFPSVDLTNIRQLKIDGNGNVRFDNIYFGSDAAVVVSGCTDSSADNYNDAATQNDGSCTYPVPGCTDSTADNYNNAATQNDGSCTYPIPGCTDNTANNYNAAATENDGSCTFTEDVLSIFSDGFDDIPGVDFNPGWGQATQVSVGDELVYTNLNYQGTHFETPQDVSDYDYFYLDYYTDNSSELNVYVISLNPTQDSESYPVNIQTGQWNSIKIPLSTYPSVDLANVQQLKVDGNGNIRFKNLYFGANASDAISGCTDINANNYNDAATQNDGSCNYDTPKCEIPVRHLNLENQPESEILITISKLSSNALSISAESSNEDVLDKFFIGAQNTPVAQVSSTTIEGGKANLTLAWFGSVPEVGTFEILWSKESMGGNWMLTKEQTSEISLTGTCTVDQNGTPGCTDSNANNYNPNATEDDNTCEYGDGLVNVTFQVNMSNETVHPEGVYLAGGGFGQEGFLMSNGGNDIWSISLRLDPNQTYYYKFRNQPSFGTWEGFENEESLEACGSGIYNDRFIEVGSTNITSPLVAYGSCSDEAPNTGCNACAYDETCVNDVCEKITAVETTLPKVYIETENQTTIKEKTEGYVNGHVTVVPGTSIKSGATIQGLDSLVMEIRGRGNSTWYFHPKKPFQMKLAEKAKFLDMPNDKKWIFLAEHSDKTMLRNTMALEMGYTSSLDWTPEGEFAEVYINGEYNGTYNITQKVEEKSNRVDIGNDGYLMEIDQPERLDADDHFISSNSFPVIAFKAPDINDIIEESGNAAADETKNKISAFVNDFESALFGSNFSDPAIGYAKYIDVESFIDWFLINEITKNVDSRSFSSIYFNLVLDENNEGKINMGPLWDFDLSFGNNDYSASEFPTGWWVKENPWIARLMQDPEFEKQVKIKFHNLYYAQKDEMLQKISDYADALEASVSNNDLRWGPYIGTKVWPNPNEGDIATGNTNLTGYNDAINYMVNWYDTRMEWLKDNLPSVEGCMDSNASNYNNAATVQPVDENGNVLCTYLTCADVPVNGCRYNNSFAAWNENFTSENCETYGGTPCNEIQITGCTDVTATNYDFEATVDDDSCVFPSGAPACVLGTIYITEAHGSGVPEDYIEIYNSGSEDCTLLGFTFDDEQPFDDLTFGDVVIVAGGYLVFYEDAENSFSSGIGSGGDKLYLGDAEGNVSMFESLAGDLGATNFTADGARCAAEPTPGALNSACIDYVEGCTDPTASNYNSEAVINTNCEYTANVPACILGTVYITEAHGKGDPEDYIEIYNSGDTDCSLLGFMLDDEQPFGDLTFGDVVISAGAYWVGEEDAEGSFGSGIGGGGDSLYLGDGQGSYLVVASLDGDLGATNFIADGTGCSAVPSPGVLNNDCTVFVEGCTDPTASNYNSEANLEDDSCEYVAVVPACVLGTVYITEAHGKGDPEDYIEIYNSGDTDCTLLGFMLDDEQPFDDLTFGDVVISAGAYWVGEEDAEGSFGSGIGGGGDSLYLGDAQGNYLVVASLDGDLGATNFTADGTGCSAVPSPGVLNNDCTVFVEGCTDPTASNYNSEANLEDDSCEYTNCSPDWQEIITNQNHSIFITGSWNDVNGNPMSDGAILGVFYEDDDGLLKSAGWTEYAEGTVQIAAMGDDNSTNEIDGLTAGEELVYRVWDPLTCEEYGATVTYSNGPQTYEGNGITFINSVNATPPGPSQQVLNLVKGWSIISTYMIPYEKDLSTVLAPIVDKIIIAKNNAGLAYLPEYNFNGVGDVKVGQGYQIKTTEATDITISGVYANPENHTIDYEEGWNMIGYLRTEGALTDLVLEDMVANGHVVIAKNSTGLAYLPEYNFNGIGNMNPGEGYQMKTTAAGTMRYHANEDDYRSSYIEVTKSKTSYFPKVTSTGNNMTVIFQDEAWDEAPKTGAEIAAYDASGELIASSAYTSPVTVLSVWGDDATTNLKDGLVKSELAQFKVWNTDQVKDLYVKSWSKGSSAYNKDAINVASSISSVAELNSSESKKLVKTVNILGQEVSLEDVLFKATVFFNIYDDGSVEKVVK